MTIMGDRFWGMENRKLGLWKALIKHIAGTTTTGLHTVGMWNELRLPASVAFYEVCVSWPGKRWSNKHRSTHLAVEACMLILHGWPMPCFTTSAVEKPGASWPERQGTAQMRAS